MLLTYLLVYAVQFFLVGCLMAGGCKKIEERYGLPFSGLDAGGYVLTAFMSLFPILGPLAAVLGCAISGFVGFTTQWTADK